MKHQSPTELRQAATVVPAPMTRQERLARWADLLEEHEGPLEALYRIEYLPEPERRAYRGGSATPLAIAAGDPVMRTDGLAGDTLGDAMDYFEISDEDAHRLLCDCHYMGSLTGRGLASRLRRYAEGGGVASWARSILGGRHG
jgi:hypothetical protein